MSWYSSLSKFTKKAVGTDYPLSSIFPLLIMLFSLLGRSQSNKVLTTQEIDSLSLASNPYYERNRELDLSFFNNLLEQSLDQGYEKGIAHSYLNLGRYYYFKDKKVDSAIAYCDKTILMVERTGIARKELLELAYSLKASFLAEAGLVLLSLESFEKAYAVALEDNEPEAIARAKVNLAEMNRRLGNFDKAISLSKELIVEIDVDYDQIPITFLNGIIGASLVQKKQPELAIPYLKRSDSLGGVISNYYQVIIDARTWMAHAYMDMGEYQRGITISETILEEFQGYQENLRLTYLVLGKSLLRNKQLAEGIQILKAGLTVSGNKEDEITLLETLAEAYLSHGIAGPVEPLISEAIRLRDSMQNARDRHFSRYSSISYDLLDTQFKNNNLAHRNETLEAKALQREYIMGLLALSIVVILLSLLGYVLWTKYSKGENTIKTLKANEKSMLEAHIKLREDELNATTVHLAKSVETLDTIIEELQTGLANKDHAALVRIKNMLKDHREASSATSLLSDRIESQYPGISSYLMQRYPNFTSNDVKHCLMIKLGLSLKETAQLFNITVAAVKSARGRMRKKMGVGTEVSLKQHLSEIAKSA